MNADKGDLTLVEFFDGVASDTILKLIIVLLQDKKVGESRTVEESSFLLVVFRAAETAMRNRQKVKS